MCTWSASTGIAIPMTRYAAKTPATMGGVAEGVLDAVTGTLYMYMPPLTLSTAPVM